MPNAKHIGFSLVELSIVLVILGLLTGGILAGQSLIKAAELRSISTEYNRFLTASQTFRDKYFAIPGDFNKATDFWGPAHATPASCPAAAGGGTLTCNGDGSGKITQPGAANQFGEMFTYWQHLANAGLIEGTYTGKTGAGGPANAVAGNVPISKFSNGSWFIFNWDNSFTGTANSNFNGTYRENIYQYGSIGGTGSNASPVLKPEELWNIDTKLDDGRPAYGSVRARFIANCTNAVDSSDLAASYALSNAGNVCLGFFFTP